MVKSEVIDQIKYQLKKLNYANHPVIIEAVLNDVYNQIMFDTSPRKLQYFEFYTKDYEVTVSLDSGSNRYYSTLPATIVQLQIPQQGVVSINSKKGTGFRIYPTSEREVRYTANLESGLYDRYYGFYVHRDKVWYVNYDAELAAAGVRMALAVQFRDFAATDEVPIPGGRNYDLKQLAVDYIRQTQILDLQIKK
jgi:hypothetical protein